jgi:deoxyribodipyrimidine photolyase
MDEEIIEIYKEYRIEINPVPKHKFDFDDFGWAFQVFKDDELYFRMVVKTANSRKTDANKTRVRTWGKEKIHALLDTGSFEKGADYCYKWIDLPNNLVPKKVNCKDFLKKS